MPQKVFLLAVLVLGMLAAGGAAAHAQPGAATPEAAFSQAFALYEAGLYGEAARAFDSFRATFPGHLRDAEALYYGGRAELAAGRTARAAQLLEAFRRRFPGHPLAPRARLALGEHFFARGDYLEAISALRVALDDLRTSEEAAGALLMIGHAGLRAGQYQTAVADLNRVVEEYPRTDAAPRALYAIGQAAYDEADYETAADAFSRLASRYRRTSEDRLVGFKLAEAFLRTGQLGRVVPEVERRLSELPPTDIEGGLPVAPATAAERRAARDRGHFLAGEAMLRQGDARAAEAHFSAVAEDGVLGARASFGLARARFELGDWDAAAMRFDSVGQARGQHALEAEALYYAGLAHRRAGRLADASERFTASVARHPDGSYADLALFERGMLQYVTRDWDEAARSFENLLDRYPGSTHVGEAARMLAETFAALGDVPRAEAAAARAQQLGAVSPELAVEVDFQRGYRALLDGDYVRAEELLVSVYDAGAFGERAGEALFWAAEAAFQLGQSGRADALGRARQRFDNFLQRFPDHRQRDAARYALAWTHFKRAEYGRAAEAFERFLAAYRPDGEMVPYASDARLRLADSYFALRRWDEAAAAYRRIEGAGADYARFQIGQALANAGRSADAVAAYNHLLANFPDSPLRPQARYAIGDLRFQEGHYDEAVQIFEQVLAQHPGSPIAARAQFAIGDARYNQGRLQEAVAAYRAVLDRFPRSPLVPDAISAIELALGGLGREDEVARIVDSFERRNPGAVAVDELRLRQAESRFQRGDHRGAVQDLTALLDTARDSDVAAPALLYLGRAHANLGEVAAAENAFRRLIDRYPNSPLRAEASRRLGALMLDLGRFADAVPLFSTAADLAETEADGGEARLGLAAALIGLGRHAEAAPLLQAVIADGSSAALVTRARLRLATVHEATGRSGESVRLLEQVALGDDGAGGAEAAGRLATLLRRQGDFHSVISITDQIRPEERFAGYPDRVAEVLLARARAFRELGQAGRAQETFDRIVRGYPDTPAAVQARRERDA